MYTSVILDGIYSSEKPEDIVKAPGIEIMIGGYSDTHRVSVKLTFAEASKLFNEIKEQFTRYSIAKTQVDVALTEANMGDVINDDTEVFV